MDAFLEAYVEAALWSEVDHDTEKPFDDDYCSSDISPHTLERMRLECEQFIELAGWMIPADKVEQAGHDFWLTRQGHGCGFWDGDWPEYGDALTEVCKRFMGIFLFVNDNGQVCADHDGF